MSGGTAAALYVKAVAMLCLVVAPTANAQSSAPLLAAGALREPDCSYLRCSLSIAPSWSGLDVVNGASGSRVASLGFFWPSSLGSAFSANDSATYYATRALHVRRTAAAFTDFGALLIGYTALRQLRGNLDNRSRVVGAIGAGAFAISVPLHFSADALLGRAVWWQNARYAR